LLTSFVNNAGLSVKDYRCVLINLKQNRTKRRDEGLRLAEAASKAGMAVVMIPDHDAAATTIEANGWLHFRKPFIIEDVDDVIARAGGEKLEARSPRSSVSSP
jgi:hypothetical protein